MSDQRTLSEVRGGRWKGNIAEIRAAYFWSRDVEEAEGRHNDE